MRRTLRHQRNPRLRYAPIGPRTIRRELIKRRVKPVPSLSTLQRIVRRGGLTDSNPTNQADPYRPHPPADSPNAVQATDIITRWIEGGETVQTFTTVDLFSNAAFVTSGAHKSTDAAQQHLLQTWQTLGVPNLAQFDNESVFGGGRHPHGLGRIVRLCLYFGIEVLFTPEDEADYNCSIAMSNRLSLWPRWVAANACGEMLGLGLTFAAVALVAARLQNQAGAAVVLFSFLFAVASGAIEATLVGLAQWWAMRPWFPTITRRAWWLKG